MCEKQDKDDDKNQISLAKKKNHSLDDKKAGLIITFWDFHCLTQLQPVTGYLAIQKWVQIC